MPRLLQIRTGRTRLMGDHPTAYGKSRRDGPVIAREMGLEGDEVANTRVHGGIEKAVYAYGAGNYALWSAEHPAHASRLLPGAFGENLLIEGLDESNVCIGDRWRIGEALVEPCQPRQPCATLGHWFGDPHMVKAMVKNGRSGWYLRVLEEGAMEPGEIRLEHRPAGAWTVAKVLAVSYRNPPDREELASLARAHGLATNWANWAGRMAGSEKPTAKTL